MKENKLTPEMSALLANAEGGAFAQIASKWRRAMRNGTGAKFTHKQLLALARTPVWDLVSEAERRELIEPYAPKPEADAPAPAPSASKRKRE